MDDIDLNNEAFTSIGALDTRAFSGSFDGNGHSVLNLNVDRPINNNGSALFGCAENASIHDLPLQALCREETTPPA